MRHHGVAGVGLVVDQHLPVAAVHVAQHPTGHFQLAFGGSIDHVVYGREGVAEKIGERFALPRQTAKHKVAVHLHRAHRGHAQRRLGALQATECVATFQGYGQHSPIQLVGPGVIRTAEKFARVAVLAARDFDALVRAAVVQDTDTAIPLAHHDHGLVTHGGGDIVARLRYLAAMAHKHPGVAEHGLHLQRKHIGIDEGVAMHLTAAQPRAGVDGGWGVGHGGTDQPIKPNLERPVCCEKPCHARRPKPLRARHAVARDSTAPRAVPPRPTNGHGVGGRARGYRCSP